MKTSPLARWTCALCLGFFAALITSLPAVMIHDTAAQSVILALGGLCGIYVSTMTVKSA